MTTELKNNCVSVSYNLQSDFRCPYDLTKVHSWGIKWNTLYVEVKKGDDVEEFEPFNDCGGYDFKRPDYDDICDEDDVKYDEYKEDME